MKWLFPAQLKGLVCHRLLTKTFAVQVSFLRHLAEPSFIIPFLQACLFVWLWLVVNNRKFSAGTIFFSHTNQPAVLLHEPATIRTSQPNRLKCDFKHLIGWTSCQNLVLCQPVASPSLEDCNISEEFSPQTNPGM